MSFKARLRTELNPEQCEAASHIDGPLLILAGAGSGKTRTIIYRIAYLLEQGFNPGSVLAVSFTNKAVREMGERAAGMLGSPSLARKLVLRTFHSLGVMMLRQEYHRIGYPRRFTIYDYGDQLASMRRVMREKKINDKDIDPKWILSEISNAKNQLLEPDQVRERVVREVYRAYDGFLKALGAVDFDDLIRLPVRLLREDPEVLETWAGRFEQIMIDEYQDTNAAQLAMVKSLASVHNNLCVVGDDDQSIYGWRGSDVENIRQFDKQFPGAKVIKLTQNYRCSGNILEAANKVIERSKGRRAKVLWTDAKAGPKIGLTVTATEDDEARFVADMLQRRQYDLQCKWEDFAILYRTNAQSRAFEDVLRRERIPYRLVGGVQFYERKEVRDAVAYLKVIDNEDEIALRRILNYPPRGIGNTTVEWISKHAKANKLSFYKACCDVHEIEQVGKAQRKAVEGFVTMIQAYQAREGKGEKLSVLFQDLMTNLRLRQQLYQEFKELKDASRRIENLESLVNSLEHYENGEQKISLNDYLDRISLDAKSEDSSKKDEDAVTLITLHGAKGLEFPIVFLVGVEESFMPYYRKDPGSEVSTTGPSMNLEEERRLCYVGITRAKHELYLTRAKTRRRFGKTLKREESRFLADIPRAALRYLGSDGEEIGRAGPKESSEKKMSRFFRDMDALFNK